MTVEDNVRIGLHNQVRYGMFTGIFRLPGYWKQERAQHEQALRLLSIFGMQDMADVKAGSLPYGAQRRLEIVRAPGCRILPSLCWTRPPQGRNPTRPRGSFTTSSRSAMNSKIAVMLVSTMNLVMGICEGICVLNYGRIIAKGTAEEIQQNPWSQGLPGQAKEDAP